MRVLFVNPVLRTAESNSIPAAKSIRDSLGFTFCDSFRKQGHEVTLLAASDYLPSQPEAYPFNVLYFNSIFKFVFPPRVIPFMPRMISHLFWNRNSYDLIISSELHTIHSMICALLVPKKLVVWHELSHHFRKFHKIPSRLFFSFSKLIYGRVFKICPRSERAGKFLANYFGNVCDNPIGHGVDLEKFFTSEEMDDCFLVCSQLIERKRVDETIQKFARYVLKYPMRSEKLVIIGDGDKQQALKDLAHSLKMDERIVFLGRLPHAEVVPRLAKAKALLISSRLDLALLSISEALACGTPVITHDGVDSSDLIRKFHLGISSSDWTEDDLFQLSSHAEEYKTSCKAQRHRFGNESIVNAFIELARRAPANRNT